jgi:hypothetical protein
MSGLDGQDGQARVGSLCYAASNAKAVEELHILFPYRTLVQDKGLGNAHGRQI